MAGNYSVLWVSVYSSSTVSPTTFIFSSRWKIKTAAQFPPVTISSEPCSSRPSRQFVPASARYPASLQRNRQESRLKRQAELLALQERTCVSRTNPPLPPAPPPPLSPPQQPQEPRLCSNPTQTRSSPSRKVSSVQILKSWFSLH